MSSKKISRSARMTGERILAKERQAQKNLNLLLPGQEPPEVNVQSTVVYRYLQESVKPITIFQGGARASKTYNIILWFVLKLMKEDRKILSICRGSLPTIRGTVFRDFQEILERLGIWRQENFNGTHFTYKLGTNLVEFISTDQPQKIRGRKRDYLFMNECNEIDLESAIQLMVRTTDKVVIDYNPSELYGWYYDWQERSDADFYIVTYKDNPFLPERIIQEIERLQEADVNYWRVYGLGERAISTKLVFIHQRITSKFPDSYDDEFYGLDFGYNHPTALIRILEKDKAFYLQEAIYQSKMTNSDLVARMEELFIDKVSPIYADSAAPEAVKEVELAGFNVSFADKDVFEGIKRMKASPLYIHEDSNNLIRQMKRYSWKTDRQGNIIVPEQPVKFDDDAIDASRYGIFTHTNQAVLDWTHL